MIKHFFCILMLCNLAPWAAQAAAIGYREIELRDTSGTRNLHVAVWYPTAEKRLQAAVGEDVIFYGVDAIENASPTTQEPKPLVVLSHGYGGSQQNLNWLAAELAGKGYVVAAPNHPGTTAFNKDPAEAQKLWERPRDISRVIDALLADSVSFGPIDPQRIAVVGHSLGGWTVGALAGARFDTDRFMEDCRSQPDPFTCGLADKLGIATNADLKTRLDGDMSDPRISAFVSMDIGLARGFTSQSLNAISKPFLVIGAGTGIGGLPMQMESGYIAQHLRGDASRLVEIADAMHFSFIQLCKPEALDILAADSPADTIICKDGGTQGRAEIHRRIADSVIGFLAAAIPVIQDRSG